MITRIQKFLFAHAMPFSLYDAMYVVYEECGDCCRARTHRPFIHPIETVGEWLDAAEAAGWTPPNLEPDPECPYWQPFECK